MAGAFRAATALDKDEKDEMILKLSELYKESLERNGLQESDIAALLFTVTDDLKAINPAKALRSSGHVARTPLFCMAEPEYEGSSPRMVRLLFILKENKEGLKPCYLGRAATLRPDL